MDLTLIRVMEYRLDVGIGAVYNLGAAAIFVSGWNLSLPTETELLLWSIPSLACLVDVLCMLELLWCQRSSMATKCTCSKMARCVRWVVQSGG
jgi:hypothetical protein